MCQCYDGDTQCYDGECWCLINKTLHEFGLHSNEEPVNDWSVHDAYGIRPFEDAYGRPTLLSGHSYNPYSQQPETFRQYNGEANDWGVHDAYGIRPYEDAYGTPVLSTRDIYHPYSTSPEQYRPTNYAARDEGETQWIQ